jgi:hypothetical protein
VILILRTKVARRGLPPLAPERWITTTPQRAARCSPAACLIVRERHAPYPRKIPSGCQRHVQKRRWDPRETSFECVRAGQASRQRRPIHVEEQPCHWLFCTQLQSYLQGVPFQLGALTDQPARGGRLYMAIYGATFKVHGRHFSRRVTQLFGRVW